MKPVIMLVAVAAGAIALSGCGGDGSSGTTTATETAPAVTTIATTPVETASTTETTAAPRPTSIVVVVKQGRPQGGIQRPTVRKGEQVVLVVRSDAGEQVHLHGYDIERDLVPGKPLRIPFTANLPGRFELELHHPDALLAVIEVRP